MRWALTRVSAVCLLTFHSPDGLELLVRSDEIKAIKPVDNVNALHLAPKTHSIIYLGVRPNGFGVIENTQEILRQIRECRDEK